MSMTNQKKDSAAGIIIPVILATLFVSETLFGQDTKTTVSQTLHAITVSYKFELLKPGDTEINTLNDSLRFYFLNELTICRLFIPYEQVKVKMDRKGNITEKKLIDWGTRSRYFVYDKNNRYGLLYDSLTVTKARKLPVDSLLKKRLTTNAAMFYNSNDSLVATIRRSEEILEEKYIPIVKYDETYPDSIYLYYNKQLVDVTFSFSEELDGLKKTKLCKARFIYNPRRAARENIVLPRRELLFQVKKTPVTDQIEITALFERFKKDGAGR